MMKTSILLLFFVIAATITFSQPSITSFSPASGPVGTAVTITGSNFSPIPANNYVFFGAVKAAITSATASSIVVTVPNGATYQPITVVTNYLTAYSKKPFVLTFTGAESGFTTGSFISVVDSVTGATPYDVTVCDIDGDRKPDILTANNIAGTFSVHKNTSSGTEVSLAAKLDFSLGSGPYGIAAADIDGDGRPDVVVTNYNDNNVSVIKNISTPGNIAFAPTVNFATGNAPEHIAIYDLDMDGKPDMAVTNFFDNTISLLRNTGNNGTISFAPKVDITLGLAPNRLAIGDLDADGKADIAVTCELSNGARVLRNVSSVGSFSFVAGFTFFTGRNPTGICIGDLDGDDVPDLAVSNSLSNQYTGISTFSVLRNISSAGNINFIKTDIATQGSPSDIALSDLDGDGKIDVAASSQGPFISLFKNISSIGNVSFNAGVNSPANSPFRLAVSDMDGDGKSDIVAGNVAGKVCVLRNRLNEMVITSFTPTTIGSGGMVTITGLNFSGITTVSFGGIPATSFTVVSPTTITAIVGAGNSGNISVTNSTATVTYPGFTFIGAPTISKITPDSAGYGQTVTISGNNFSNATEVSFGGTHTSFKIVSPTTIEAKIESGTSGNVTVTTPYGTAEFSGFTYIPTPVITSFAPVKAGQGTIVSITGFNFLGTSSVSFGGVSAASFVVESSTTITAVPGNGASGDVSVTTAYGTANSPGFVFLPAPTITSFTPVGGVNGTVVTVNGTNFDNIIHVTVGGVSYDFSYIFISSTQIQIPINAQGASGSIVITTPGGTASMPGFVFNPQPTVSSISPSEAGTGMTVNITGTNFTGTTSVTFGGVPASSFIINSPTSISAVIGSGATGNVIVTNSYGVNVWSPIFIYTNRPIINSFSPDSGPVGSIVTITGGNFNTTPTNNHVYFGAVEATVVSSTNLSLTIAVPTGATYEPFTVTNTNLTGYATKPFDITFPGGGIPFTENSFAGKIDFVAGSDPDDIKIADLDNDGKPDVIINRGDTISVYRNITTNGVITFAPRVDVSFATHNIQAFAIGDINGDSKLDIVIATENQGNNDNGFVLKNTSTIGNLSFTTGTTFITASRATEIAIGDLNSDGRPDIAMCYGGLAAVSLYRNTTVNGIISLEVRTISLPESISDDGLYAASISISDFNNDGLQDLVIGSESNHFYILKNGSGLYGFTFTALRKEGFFAKSLNFITPADFNLDGNQDFISTNYLFTGKSNFNFSASHISDIGGEMSMGDLDGDGKPDFASIKYPNPAIVYVTRNSTLASDISFESSVNYASGSTPKDLAVGDLDGDGRPDIAFTRVGDTFSILKNLVGTVGICPNGGTTITSNIPGGSYQWQVNVGTGFSDISDNANYSGTKTITIQLKNVLVSWHGYQYRCVTDKNYVSSVTTISVLPAASAGYDKSICAGGSIQLHAAGGGSYSWLPATGLNNSSIADPVASPLVTTTYIVTTSNGNCTSSDSVVISVNTTPRVNSGNDTAVCLGNSVQLIGSGDGDYSWSPVAGLSNPNIANPVASPSITTVYTLTVSNGNCVASDSIIILVNAEAGADAGPDTSICSGTSIQLHGSGGDRYSWSPATDLSNPNVSDPIASPGVTTSYILTVFNVKGCIATDTVTITVDSPLASDVSITTTADNVCLGSPVTFIAKVIGRGTNPVYQWQVNDKNVGFNSVTFTSSSLYNNDQVKVIVTNTAGCAISRSDTSNIVTMKIDELAAPIVSTDNSIFNITNPDADATYRWQILKDTLWQHVVPIATELSYGAAASGTYRVMAIKGTCKTYSLPNILSISPDNSGFGIYLYPNPTSSTITLDSLPLSQNWEILNIMDANGRYALPAVNIRNQTTVLVDISSLQNGIYFARLTRKDGVFTAIKFVKQ